MKVFSILKNLWKFAKDYSDTNLVTAKSYSDTNLNTAKSYTDSSLINKANCAYGTAQATDFNNITNQGVYWIDMNKTTGNRPVAAWGVLEVIRTGPNTTGGNVFQRFQEWNTTSIYVRLHVNGSWQAWRKCT